MFAKLIVLALAIAAVAARPGISAVTSYSAPAVVAARSPYVSSTYHGVAAPLAYSSYASPVAYAAPAYSAYAAPAVSAYSSPLSSYSYGTPLTYSTYGVSPYSYY